jgi:histidine triad (HIT) family protein
MTVFDRILKREIPAKVVFEDEQVLAFHDVNPQAPVHVLVIPKRAIPRLSDTVDADVPLLGHLLASARNVARMLGLEEDGYRVVVNVGFDGGQSVEHLHLHVMGGRPFVWPPG